ncbi:hypothetical protein, partial [Mesorhizobium sp. M7A.F.Ca.CA.001.14.1.1]|uniref:hypothetical protein n=1 Tax=Mesorhizobium sp. M7A.F.Ca.CA.001.14.1.1 TaxID=2496706 RepID=UPI0019D47261
PRPGAHRSASGAGPPRSSKFQRLLRWVGSRRLCQQGNFSPQRRHMPFDQAHVLGVDGHHGRRLVVALWLTVTLSPSMRVIGPINSICCQSSLRSRIDTTECGK